MNATNNRKILTKRDVLTGLMCLLGMAPGLACWRRLPDEIPIHWGIDNQPNGWGSKAFVVFGLPLMMIVLHLLCCLADNLTYKADTQPKAVKWLVRLIIPVITLVLECVTMLFVLDLFTDIGLICCLLLGVLMIVLGNYMPKTRPNPTFGIKLPWTLHDEDVWCKTHRLAGWLMVAGGIVLIVTAFLRAYAVGFVAMVAAILVPAVYSYVISRKKA